MDLIRVAIKITQERSWWLRDSYNPFTFLCEDFAAASMPIQLNGSPRVEALRAVIREEICRAGIGDAVSPTAQFDTEALRQVVANEVRAGVSAAGPQSLSRR